METPFLSLKTKNIISCRILHHSQDGAQMIFYAVAELPQQVFVRVMCIYICVCVCGRKTPYLKRDRLGTEIYLEYRVSQPASKLHCTCGLPRPPYPGASDQA